MYIYVYRHAPDRSSSEGPAETDRPIPVSPSGFPIPDPELPRPELPRPELPRPELPRPAFPRPEVPSPEPPSPVMFSPEPLIPEFKVELPNPELKPAFRTGATLSLP